MGINQRLLSRLVGEKKDLSQEKWRKKYGLFAGLMGMITNLILALVKVVVGILSGSISVIGDGLNNLADGMASVITYVGFHLAALPADSKHPYGHQRIEYLTGLFVSVFILLVGGLLFKESIEKILSPTPLKTGLVVYVILALSILVKWWQRCFYKAAYEKIRSLALKAASIDSRNDLVATAVVLLGLLLGKWTGWSLDGYLGLLVSIFILWSGVSLVYETASPLLGEAPDDQLIQDLLELVAGESTSLGVHDVMVHNYGPGKTFVSLHVEFDSNTDLLVCHERVESLEQRISEELGIHGVIHIDPVVQNDPLIEKVKPLLTGLIEPMDGVRSFHDLRVVPGQNTTLIFDLVIALDCPLAREEIQEQLEEKIREHYPHCVLSIHFDPEYTPL